LKRWLEDERDFLVWRGELEARRQEYDMAAQAGARQQRHHWMTFPPWLRRGDG
jgi:hypothetical protein